MASGSSKITESHLSRKGYVYIRQSTQYQVENNQESTMRQYDMKKRLVELGWDADRIVILDQDLGFSGKTVAERKGFQILMADLINEKVGAVATLEASRLSRSSSDFAKLIEVCVMTNTLLVDAEGVYDPKEFNDGLILDIKGTISAAELHFLQERMRGGLINKAQRGELKRYLPIGYEYDLDNNVVKATDISVKEAVEQFFTLFRQIKSAYGLACYYDEHDMKFPCRLRMRSRADEVIWDTLNEERALAMIHNPFYTGRYVFGRTQVTWVRGTRRPMPAPEEKWHANIPNHHEAYITEEEFNTNQLILSQNRQQFLPDGDNDRKTAPREGECLLQGIAYCARCGSRMHAIYGYNEKKKAMIPKYCCSGKRMDGPYECGIIVGAIPIDEAVAKAAVSKLAPNIVNLTADIHEEVVARKKDHLRYFELQLQKAKQEEESAKVRYFSADATNRLVIPELEAHWNKKLYALNAAQERYDEEVKKASLVAEEETNEFLSKLTSLGEDFEKAWNNPLLENADKKRLIRCIIEDVTLRRYETEYKCRVQIRYQGGATEEIDVPIPAPRYVRIATPEPVLDFLRVESYNHPACELSDLLNEKGFTRECKRPFTPKCVHRIMKSYKIPSMKRHYLDAGWVSTKEMAEKLGVVPATLRYRIDHENYPGAWRVVDCGEILFYPDPEAKDVSYPVFTDESSKDSD